MSDLQRLIGQSLKRKDGGEVKITSLSLALGDIKITEDVPFNFPLSHKSMPQYVGTPVINKNDLW